MLSELNELFNRVCREMPEGWELTVALEHGYGDVDLVDPDLRLVVPVEYCHEQDTMVERIEKALQYAKENR